MKVNANDVLLHLEQEITRNKKYIDFMLKNTFHSEDHKEGMHIAYQHVLEMIYSLKELEIERTIK
jgi:hypothetical protein